MLNYSLRKAHGRRTFVIVGLHVRETFAEIDQLNQRRLARIAACTRKASWGVQQGSDADGREQATMAGVWVLRTV